MLLYVGKKDQSHRVRGLGLDQPIGFAVVGNGLCADYEKKKLYS